MANANDTYAIERDERDMGGEVTVIAVFEDYQAALAVWEQVPTPQNENITMWLLRRIGGSTRIDDAIAIDVKCR